MSFPTKEERAVCWGARDKYWTCLDQNKEQEAVKDGPCAAFRKLYEQSCSSQWVKHFDRRRSYLQFKQKIETEGYEPLDSDNYKKISNSNASNKDLHPKRRIYAAIAII